MSNEIKTENGEVLGFDIQMDRGSFLCPWITIGHGDGAQQGFGGYVFGFSETTDKDGKRRNEEMKSNALGKYLARLYWVFEVESLHELKGKPCRITHEGWGGRILAVGNFRKERWLDVAFIEGCFKGGAA